MHVPGSGQGLSCYKTQGSPLPPRADSISREGARLGFSETGQPRCPRNLFSHDEETLPARGMNGTGSFHQKDRLWQRRAARCERQQEKPEGNQAGCSCWRGWPGQRPDSTDIERTVKSAPWRCAVGALRQGGEGRHPGWSGGRECAENQGKGRKECKDPPPSAPSLPPWERSLNLEVNLPLRLVQENHTIEFPRKGTSPRTVPGLFLWRSSRAHAA